MSRGLGRAAVLLVLALLSGCPSTGGANQDAALPRDAMVVDSTLITDAASDAGPANDASTLDGGLAACGGSCDPRRASSCNGTLVCRFAGGVPTCTMPVPSDAGAGDEGADCAYDTDCRDGLACFGAAGLGTCARPCCGARDDCSASERCRGDGALVDGSTTVWGRCMSPVSCDLAHPEHTCATREGCYIVDQTGATECLIAGRVPQGSACTRAADCTPGHVCAGLTARTCVAICWLGSTAPHQGCGDTEHCEAQAYSPPGTGICTAN